MKKPRRHKQPFRRFKRLLPFAALFFLVLLAVEIHFALQDRRDARRECDMLPLIQEAAATHNLPVSLVRALVWKESRFNPDAVGTKKEIGLMQITDGAATDWAEMHHRPAPSRNSRFDPAVNLEIGCWYLARAGKHWNGYASKDILQLAEYNAGRAKVLRDWKPEDPAQEISLDHITFPGTQDYVRQILTRKQYYERQEARHPSTLQHHD